MSSAKIPYFADERKYIFRTKKPIFLTKKDKEADQFIRVNGSISGIIIWPEKRWTPLCDKVFRKTRANALRLEQISCAPGGSLEFVKDLPGCKRLIVEEGEKADLSPLKGSRLEDLMLGPSMRVNEFDLESLPNLRRCQIPLQPELMSFLNCRRLVCLWLNGGGHDGILKMTSLPKLEEFICSGVSKLKGVVFHPKVRLRALELLHLKLFESLEPRKTITQDLRVVELGWVPRMEIEWLREAKKADCIALRVGKIPSINFLKELKHLEVLDLFGSKIEDRDFSFRDSLKGELDPRLWSSKS